MLASFCSVFFPMTNWQQGKKQSLIFFPKQEQRANTLLKQPLKLKTTITYLFKQNYETKAKVYTHY